ncbi:hypothetical protein ACH0BF_00370 [Pseudobacillus sp. 179-B 2D1 NHS]|uniref:hypothetical protein n=1 Tax=Pseudobacillus sp. 179-B 2D1 NHS TaxID=3374292 RepID=UPI00387A1DD0
MIDIREHGGIFSGGSSTKIKGEVSEKVTFAEDIKYGEPVSVKYETKQLPKPIGFFTDHIDTAISEDGNYVAVVQRMGETSRYGSIAFFKRIGDELVKLPNPDIMPEKNCAGVAFYKNNLVAFAHAGENSTTGAGVTLYKRIGDSFVKVANTITGIQGGRKTMFSPDGNYLFVRRWIGSSQTSGILVYRILNANTADLVEFHYLTLLTTGPVPRDIAISNDSRYIVISEWNSTLVYENLGDNTFRRATEIESSLVITTEGVTFSSNDELLIFNKGTNNNQIVVYQWNNGNPVEIDNAIDKQPSVNIGSAGANLLRFHPNGKILFVNGGRNRYKRNGDKFHLLQSINMGGTGDWNITISPDGEHLIGANYYKNELKAYKNNTVPLEGDYSLGYALQNGSIGEERKVMNIFN